MLYASWSDSAARSVVHEVSFGGRLFRSCVLEDVATGPLLGLHVLLLDLVSPNDAGACRICAIAQIRNYRRDVAAESMNSDRAWRSLRVSRRCFSR